jgi:hypothetical protein
MEPVKIAEDYDTVVIDIWHTIKAAYICEIFYGTIYPSYGLLVSINIHPWIKPEWR